MKKLLIVSLLIALVAGFAFANGEGEASSASFAGKNVRVVIGSTSTSGDSYLISSTVCRYLAEALGCNMKVDGLKSGEDFYALATDKGQGDVIEIFHDMFYLSTPFGAQGPEYALENFTIGPRVAQNPTSCWATRKSAPYTTLVEAADWLKANPSEVVRYSCESGGVSHCAFIVYWNWVNETYGADVSSRMKVVIGGSTDKKLQQIWDNNTDIIFADVKSLMQYTQTDDPKLALKFSATPDNMDGVDVPSYADLGITLNGEPFRFSKDFVIYLPKNVDANLVAELEAAVAKINADPNLQADLAKMNYRTGDYMTVAETAEFIQNKYNGLAGLIATAPSLDSLM